MSTHPAPSFGELAPELYPVIVEKLPLVYRPSTLLSLALACRRLYDIVYPELLYDSIRLVGEDQALKTLDTLIETAKPVTEEDIRIRGNPSLSHCIHHLSLNTVIDTPIRTHTSLDALKKLVEINGLRHLECLALYPIASWDGTTEDGSPTLKLSSSFLSSLKIHCPNLKRIHVSRISQKYQEEWIEPYVFCLENLTSIHIESRLLAYPTPTLDLSRLPTTNLDTLELRLIAEQPIDASALLHCVIPNLRTLIIDNLSVSDTISVNEFWCTHPRIERLELFDRVVGSWFDGLEGEALMNLKYLLCTFDHALTLLPRVSKSLISLSLCATYNAQGPYLLRAVCPGGVLPALRSLSIHSISVNSPKSLEGNRWREDENGEVSLADADTENPARRFDGNYIMSLAKAAPNVEELELMGKFSDTMASLFCYFSFCDSIYLSVR